MPTEFLGHLGFLRFQTCDSRLCVLRGQSDTEEKLEWYFSAGNRTAGNVAYILTTVLIVCFPKHCQPLFMCMY